MINHIFSYLFTGLIVAAVYDIWIDPKLGINLTVKQRIMMSIIMTVGWLPILGYSIYLSITGKDLK